MQISEGLLAATQSLLTSPSPPPFLTSFTIWSVSPLPSQPSSSVPWILFFLPALCSVANTLRMVLVTFSRSPGGQEHHSKLEDPTKFAKQLLSLKPFLPHTLLFIYLAKTVVQLLKSARGTSEFALEKLYSALLIQDVTSFLLFQCLEGKG